RAETAAAVPSLDALSTTTIRGRSGRCVRWSSVRNASSRRLCVIITTETRGSPRPLMTPHPPAARAHSLNPPPPPPPPYPLAHRPSPSHRSQDKKAPYHPSRVRSTFGAGQGRTPTVPTATCLT